MGDLPDTIDASRASVNRGDGRLFLMVFPGEGLASRVLEMADGVEVTLGRSRTATVTVDDDRVSRLHTKIAMKGVELIVEDLGSRNGTRVNGAKIDRPARIGLGATIVVGPALVVVRRAERVEVEPDDAPISYDPAMRQVHEMIDKVAPTAMTVLILGETGVGKELVAEALHARSERGAGPLVRLNCASLPETLLESELFGHEKGAFTGADRRKVGFFEAAEGGTLFLDEIGEMPVSLQPKLLRALEHRTVIRVGGTSEVPVDVRLIAATHRDLEAEIRAGKFREDLFFRISSFTLRVPPLRERPADILPLAAHFAAVFAAALEQPPPTLTAGARALLQGHAWPGNVRELRNAIERAVVMQSNAVIEPEHLPERVREAAPARPVVATDSLDVREQLADVERAAIVAALEATGNNQTRAAERLGLSRRALIYKLEKYGLKPAPKR